jgi:nitrate/TMAO reductase-like tetraheme cytochrome c subunit
MKSALMIALLIPACSFGQAGARFLPAEDCALCHTRIPRAGASWQGTQDWVGAYPLWRASMMAHSATDPYWRQKVAFETSRAPERRAVIEDTCLRCHAPADQYPKRAGSAPLALAEVGDLGRDGVTCTVCHQIEPANLGKASSFTAGFQISNGNRIFGPYPEPFTMPMLHHTGYTAVEGKHVRESALCGTCHTVITRPPGGKDDFVEQGPFLEWLASDQARAGRSCQSCHMPKLEGPQHIAHRPPGGPFPPTSPRPDYAQHFFAGGNALIPAMLAESGAERRAALLGAADRARHQLQGALSVELKQRRQGGRLAVEVLVKNLTGHKLPTGFPSRRMWLHLRATDKKGQLIFESGAYDSATGMLSAGESAQPHYAVISESRQTQIFESEALDSTGAPTLSLLAAARQGKDNRILPAGFQLERLRFAGLPAYEIGPAGVSADRGFKPGSALTTYLFPAPAEARVEVEVLFQSIKPSHHLPGLPIPQKLKAPLQIAIAKSDAQ